MIRIRSATAKDESLIASIIRASMLASYAHFLPAHQFQKVLDMDRPGQVARADAVLFVVAEVDAVPAGVMLLKGNYVDHLWAHPDFMGQGVGSVLLGHAERLAAEAGYDRLTLDCFKKNKKALAFYRARGFTLKSTYEANDYLPGEPTCSLVKDL